MGTRSATYLDCADQGFYVVGPETVTGGDTHLWPEIDGHIRGDLSFELDHFVQATRSGEPYRQSYREAFDAIPVLDALAGSAERGVAVTVDRNTYR